MELTLRQDERSLTFEAPTLEVARLVASACGWEVDVEPLEPGRVSLKAHRNGATIGVTGTTVYDAAEKLISRLTEPQR